MMTYAGSKPKGDAYKKLGEVFTPAGLVFEMIMQEGMYDCLADVDKTIFDPCCGEGQFPCAELVGKMFYNVDKLSPEVVLRAMSALYGVDIQEPSVKKTRKHLIKTMIDAYDFFTGKALPVDVQIVALKVVEENFIVGDSLKLMKEWAGENDDKQLRLFS